MSSVSHLFYTTDSSRYMMESTSHFRTLQSQQHSQQRNSSAKRTHQVKFTDFNECHEISIVDCCLLYTNSVNSSNNKTRGAKISKGRGHRSQQEPHSRLIMVVLSNGSVAQFDIDSGRLHEPIEVKKRSNSELQYKDTYIASLNNSRVVTLAIPVESICNDRSVSKAMIRVYDAAANKLVDQLAHCDLPLVSMCTIPERDWVVCGTESIDEPIAVWDIRNSVNCSYPDVLYGAPVERCFQPNHILYSSKFRMIVMASFNSNKVVICNDACNKLLAVIDCNAHNQTAQTDSNNTHSKPRVFSIGICEKQKYLFVGMRNGIIKQYDLCKYKYHQTILCHNQTCSVRELNFDHVNSTLYATQLNDSHNRSTTDNNATYISAFQMAGSNNYKIISRKMYIEPDCVLCTRVIQKRSDTRRRFTKQKKQNFEKLTSALISPDFSDVNIICQQ